MLLEALVATAVAATLLIVLMRGFSSLWHGIGGVREEAEAMMVARAVLDATAPRLNLAAGAQDGVTGRYAWSVGVVDTQLRAVISAQPRAAGANTGGDDEDNPRRPASAPAPQRFGTAGQPGQPNQQGQQGQGEPQQSEPWALFKISVAVRAPSGRSTVLETYRLSRPAR